MPTQSEPPGHDSSPSGLQGRAALVLVFEDNEALAYSLAAILRSAGFEGEVATHFWVALAALEGSNPPDLLVTDIVMPAGEVNGMAMARMARMKRPAIKILYVTGYNLQEAEREALGPILRKPVSEIELLSAVHRLINEA